MTWRPGVAGAAAGLAKLDPEPAELAPEPAELAPEPAELAPEPAELAPEPAELAELAALAELEEATVLVGAPGPVADSSDAIGPDGDPLETTITPAAAAATAKAAPGA
jgi:segregation and condensation protein B